MPDRPGNRIGKRTRGPKDDRTTPDATEAVSQPQGSGAGRLTPEFRAYLTASILDGQRWARRQLGHSVNASVRPAARGRKTNDDADQEAT